MGGYKCEGCRTRRAWEWSAGSLLESRVYAVSCGAWVGVRAVGFGTLEGKMVSRPFDAACSVFTQAAKTQRKEEFKKLHHEAREEHEGGIREEG